MMKRFAVAAILGVAVAASNANAQFVTSTIVGTPTVADSYYYSAPSYYSSPSYYVDPGYSTYSTSPSFYYGTPGFSIGFGNTYPSWGYGYGGYGWNRGYGWNNGYYGGRGYYRGGRGRWR